jgi:hypothetical protein
MRSSILGNPQPRTGVVATNQFDAMISLDQGCGSFSTRGELETQRN